LAPDIIRRSGYLITIATMIATTAAAALIRPAIPPILIHLVRLRA
jgi:hypothetical protein